MQQRLDVEVEVGRNCSKDEVGRAGEHLNILGRDAITLP